MFAASALAANTFMRSIFGGVFPLFATYMFDGMGIEWAATVRLQVPLFTLQDHIPSFISIYIINNRKLANAAIVTRLRCRPSSSYAHSFLPLWQENSCEEQVRARPGYRAG